MTRAYFARVSVVCLICFCPTWFLSNSTHAQQLTASDAVYGQAQHSIREGNLPLAISQLVALRSLDPDHAGALLDLAYLYCQMGMKERAEESLLILEVTFNPPSRIRGLIEELRLRECAVARKKTQWAAALAVGHDSNVNQGSSVRTFSLGSSENLTHLTLDNTFMPQSSAFAGLHTHLRHALDERNHFFGSFSTQHYASAKDFDLAALSAGYGHAFSTRRWQVSSDVSTGMRTLGGKLYQKSFSGQIRLLPTAEYRADFPLGFDLNLAYSRYPARTAFDNLETSFMIPGFRQFSDKLGARVSAGWLFDKALDDRPGGDRSGPMLEAEFFYRHSPEWNAYAGWQAIFPASESAYAPPLLDMTRDQRLHALSLAIEKKIAGSGSLRLEYRHLNNADSIPFYRFNSNSINMFWIIEGHL